MQPQDAQMMGQVAPAGAMGQQVIIVQNKSGGPKVFGIIAIILGGIGVVLNGLNLTADLGDLGGGYVAFYYILTLAAVASNGMFAYAGILLLQYRKSGVWWGFGAVGIQVLSTVIISLVIASALSELDEGLGKKYWNTLEHFGPIFPPEYTSHSILPILCGKERWKSLF